MATVHQDRQWWLLCLGYGFAAATLLGLPLMVGFISESFDNSRRGYPTPLPPWSDPSGRVLTGLFTMLIDFSFFVLPTLVGLMLIFAVSLGLALAGSAGQAALGPALTTIGVGLAVLLVVLWMSSVAPVGRLIFVREGQIEQALSGATVRTALERGKRAFWLRARLLSLPAYLPMLIGAGLTLAATRPRFTGQAAVVGLGLWLTMAALVYAHLIVGQLYTTAERITEQTPSSGR